MAVLLMSLEVGGKKYKRGGRDSAFEKQIEDYERRQKKEEQTREELFEQIASPALKEKHGGAVAAEPEFQVTPGRMPRRRTKVIRGPEPPPLSSRAGPDRSPELSPVVSPIEDKSHIVRGEIRPAPNNPYIPDFIEFPARRFFGGYREGAFSPAATAKQARAQGFDAPKSDPFEQTGRLLGLTSAIVAAPAAEAVGAGAVAVGGARAAAGAVKASRAGKATKAAVDAAKATKAAQAAAETARKVQEVRAVKFLDKIGVTGVAKVGAQGVAGAEATRLAARATRSLEERGGLTQKEYEGVFRDALKAAEKPEGTGVKGLGRSIAGGLNVRFVDTKKFRKEVRAGFAAEGLSGAALDAAVSQAVTEKNRVLALGEAATFVGIARASESVGRASVAKAFEKAAAKGQTTTVKQSFRDVFKLTFFPIAKAGAAEGSASVAAQDIIRGGYEDLDAKRVALGGAFGFGSAGVLGPSIAGLRPGRPGVSKAVEFGTYIVDPYEKPGDILQDITAAASKKITGRVPATPTIVQTVDPASVLQLGVSKPKGKPPKPKTGKGAPTPSPVFSFAPVPVPVPPSEPKAPKTPVPVFPAPVPGIVPSPVPVPIPVVPTDPNVPTVPTPVDVPLPVAVPVPVPININIPTVTPQLRVPPPLPLALGGGAGAGRTKRGKKRTYVDELKRSTRLINDFLGVPPALKAPKPVKAKKRKVKSAGRPRANNDPFGFFNAGRRML